MKISGYVSILFLLILSACKEAKKEEAAPVVETEEPKVKYEATAQSLAEHRESPQWFEDAKFGIYFHWGVYSVPAFGDEWYPRHMHFKNKREYAHHVKTYGELSEFGYHDFVPMFKAEKFDAEQWADLFQKAGAKFAGPVAEHHDGFSMWDSDITPWNAADKGPKKDITGLLSKALKAKGMKMITTFHHARNLQRYADSAAVSFDNVKDLDRNAFWKSHYPFFEGTPPTSTDPELRYLYGHLPPDEWHEKVWLGKVKEVVDKYQPDIIWFDSWLDEIPEQYRYEMAAYYLNEADKWGKEVVIVRKQDDLPLDFSVDDLEKSRKNRLEEKSWMTDETISKGSWCYTENLKIKSTADLVHVLIDIVSKNGVLLLNVSPKSDGTIPEDQQKALLGIGEWLKVYGESIYGTRPWYTYGEGPTKEPEGKFENNEEFLKIKYSYKDARYTTKGKTLYAHLLGWPPTKTITLTSFAKGEVPEGNEIANVTLLGSDAEIKWEMTDKGLQLTLPAKKTSEFAPVFKIERK